MAALNHIIIPAKDKDASAEFLAGILGVEAGRQWGPFRPVQTSNGVTLDFVCYKCHQDGAGEGGSNSARTLEQLSTKATGIHAP